MRLKRLKILQNLPHSNTSATFKCALLDVVACEKIFKVGLKRDKYSMVHIKFENITFLSQDLLSSVREISVAPVLKLLTF